MHLRFVTLLAIAIALRSAAAEPQGPNATSKTPRQATPDQAPEGTREVTLMVTPPVAPPVTPPVAPDEPTERAHEATPPVTPRVTRDATLGSLFRQPFPSSRLFAMPLADVVGAYMLSLSGDGSLLQKPGALTSAGVLAVGFGDIAQLEYRHTEAIGLTGLNAPVPAVGVQLKLPIPEHSGIPAVGIAFRLGVPRSETLDGTTINETVTDLYLVGRLRFARLPWLTLHGGTRISSAKAVPGEALPAEQKMLWLPTAGYEVTMNPTAKIVGEIALAPQFQYAPATEGRPAMLAIGHGVLGRLGMRWRVLPAIILDGSLGYQIDDAAPTAGFDAVVSWDIRLGAEVFVPWGALACRAAGVFCD